MSYGKDALEIFYDHNALLGHKLPFNNFSEFRSFLKNNSDRSYKILEDSLTSSIKTMHDEASFYDFTTDSDVEEAMIKLAKISQGKLPNAGAFIQALANQFSEVRLTPYFEAVESTLTAFENVGKGVLTTMNLSRWAIPVLIIGGAGMFIYFRSKRA